MDRRAFLTNGLVFLAGLGLAACEHDRRDSRYGRPVYRYNDPPNAPAHGHRHSYRRGLDLTYDAELGVYRAGDPTRDQFYYRGSFYRLNAGNWERRPNPDAPWRRTSGRELPRRMLRWGERQERTRQRRRQRREDAN
jgi:hypothetical protein